MSCRIFDALRIRGGNRVARGIAISLRVVQGPERLLKSSRWFRCRWHFCALLLPPNRTRSTLRRLEDRDSDLQKHLRTVSGARRRHREYRCLVRDACGSEILLSGWDVGDQDGLRFDAAKLHTILDSYGIANSFEIYSGTHTSAVADRFQNHVTPFFSKNLCFTKNCE